MKHINNDNFIDCDISYFLKAHNTEEKISIPKQQKQHNSKALRKKREKYAPENLEAANNLLTIRNRKKKGRSVAVGAKDTK